MGIYALSVEHVVILSKAIICKLVMVVFACWSVSQLVERR